MTFMRGLIDFSFVFAIGSIFCGPIYAQDIIELNGRSEPAHCEYEYTDPVTKVCVSESYVCRVSNGVISCEIKR